MVGAVPYEEQKVKKRLVITFLLAALVCIPLCIGILSGTWGDGDFFKTIIGMTVAAIAMVGIGLGRKRRIQINEKLTASAQTDRFAHNRQAGRGDYE